MRIILVAMRGEGRGWVRGCGHRYYITHPGRGRGWVRGCGHRYYILVAMRGEGAWVGTRMGNIVSMVWSSSWRADDGGGEVSWLLVC